LDPDEQILLRPCQSPVSILKRMLNSVSTRSLMEACNFLTSTRLVSPSFVGTNFRFECLISVDLSQGIHEGLSRNSSTSASGGAKHVYTVVL
jgi:hypothetical protein